MSEVASERECSKVQGGFWAVSGSVNNSAPVAFFTCRIAPTKECGYMALRHFHSPRSAGNHVWPSAGAGFLLLMLSHFAAADSLLGLYVGGAAGQSRVEADGGTVHLNGVRYSDTGYFDETHVAYKAMVGIRPVSLLGAEIAWMDFGHPDGVPAGPANQGFEGRPTNSSMKGASAFGVLYLPVPVVDIFLKAGVARIQSELNGTGVVTPICLPNQPCPAYDGTAAFRLSRTTTSGAGGVGAQYRLGPFAVRAEYERFNAAGGKPSLLSAGITWTFL